MPSNVQPGHVPIIGQQLYPYQVGFAGLQFPFTPAQALQWFQASMGQGWAPDPGMTLTWIATSIQTQQFTEVIVKLLQRIEQLEAQLHLEPPAGTEVAYERVADPPPEPQEAAEDLPEWARKAQAASGSGLDALAEIGADLLGDQPELDELVAGVERRACTVCGCTEEDCSQCIEKTGQPCHWVADNLCSACAHREESADAG